VWEKFELEYHVGKKPAKGKMLRLILTSVIRTKVRLLSRNNTIQDYDHILKESAGIPFNINNEMSVGNLI
jgi:hypothetical protein